MEGTGATSEAEVILPYLRLVLPAIPLACKAGGTAAVGGFWGFGPVSLGLRLHNKQNTGAVVFVLAPFFLQAIPSHTLKHPSTSEDDSRSWGAQGFQESLIEAKGQNQAKRCLFSSPWMYMSLLFSVILFPDFPNRELSFSITV